MILDPHMVMQSAVLAMVALAGAGVVLTRDPPAQTIGLSFFGLVLALMFFILQAPDVALSQIVVGTVALLLMVLLALTKINRGEIRRERNNQSREHRQ